MPTSGPQADDVRKMSHRELTELFETLECPKLEEMNGEYAARLLRQPSRLAAISGNIILNNPVLPGKWLCKAFRPVSAKNGRGYNAFDVLGRKVKRFPMLTLIAPSRFDGKPAFQLVYQAYKSFCGDIHMVDEVRRLGEGAYLGIGTWGFTDAQRMIPLPFLLEGINEAYSGDIGTGRPGFDLAKELGKHA